MTAVAMATVECGAAASRPADWMTAAGCCRRHDGAGMVSARCGAGKWYLRIVLLIVYRTTARLRILIPGHFHSLLDCE